MTERLTVETHTTVVPGPVPSTCLEATARHTVELGYHLTLVKDATGTFQHQEWTATVEINAPTFAHAIVTTAGVVAESSSEARTAGGSRDRARQRAPREHHEATRPRSAACANATDIKLQPG